MTGAVENVGAVCRRHAESGRLAAIDLRSPDAPREIGYAELDAACDALANGLAARGLGPGSRAGILAFNRVE